MSQFALPIIGFDNWEPPMRVRWADGTKLTYCGILGDMRPETLAREKAEQSRKEALRQQRNVFLLEDWRLQNDQGRKML
jgi:hypothetical protein